MVMLRWQAAIGLDPLQVFRLISASRLNIIAELLVGIIAQLSEVYTTALLGQDQRLVVVV